MELSETDILDFKFSIKFKHARKSVNECIEISGVSLQYKQYSFESKKKTIREQTAKYLITETTSRNECTIKV